jgi:hypothetical protein
MGTSMTRLGQTLNYWNAANQGIGSAVDELYTKPKEKKEFKTAMGRNARATGIEAWWDTLNPQQQGEARSHAMSKMSAIPHGANPEDYQTAYYDAMDDYKNNIMKPTDATAPAAATNPASAPTNSSPSPLGNTLLGKAASLFGSLPNTNPEVAPPEVPDFKDMLKNYSLSRNPMEGNPKANNFGF